MTNDRNTARLSFEMSAEITGVAEEFYIVWYHVKSIIRQSLH
jgi:hypothetical protein